MRTLLLTLPFKTYLYVQDNLIHGILITESIRSAYIVQKSSAQHWYTEESKQVQALVGISRIWVHDNVRKQGIASKLVDACRKSFIYGYSIPKMQVAMSQPTTHGIAFATTYFETECFAVYK